MRRSHEPLYWALFGAGGMLVAIVGPALVLVTGIVVPLGGLLPWEAWNHARLIAFVRHPGVAVVLLAVISLFLFHGCHRIRHGLHDFGWHAGRGAGRVCYGVAMAGSVVAALLLSAIVLQH